MKEKSFKEKSHLSALKKDKKKITTDSGVVDFFNFLK